MRAQYDVAMLGRSCVAIRCPRDAKRRCDGISTTAFSVLTIIKTLNLLDTLPSFVDHWKDQSLHRS